VNDALTGQPSQSHLRGIQAILVLPIRSEIQLRNDGVSRPIGSRGRDDR
jgi:hypothetical protein